MGALLSLPLFQSCLDDKNTYDPSFFHPDAIVTVKPVTDDGDEYFYFQLDDNTKLWPIDNSSLPYDEKEVRAFVKYNKVEMPADVDKEIYAEAVEVMWMDSILTKKPVVLQSGDETLDIAETYGDDPVAVAERWCSQGAKGLHIIDLDGALMGEAVNNAVDELRKEKVRSLPKYDYPDHVVTAALMQRYSKYGIDFKVRRKDCVQISAMDAQREKGKAIFGSGPLLSDNAAAERAAAERAAAHRWVLSAREREIIAKLG